MELLVYGEEELDKDTELLYVYNKINETAPLHTHDFYEFFVVASGSALHLINDSVQTIRQGDLFFIRPKDVHCYDFYHSEDFVLINLGFSKQMLQRIQYFLGNTKGMKALLENPFPKYIHLEDPQRLDVTREFLEIGDRMRKALNKVQLSFHAQTYFAFILNKYFIDYPDLELRSRNSPAWLDEVLSEMQRLENLQGGFAKLLSLSPCSKNHLCRLMKSTMNLTPTQYINEQRLNYSVFLLSQTTKDILTISEMVGFNNLSHFYHLFKQRFSCSPAQFRKRTSRGFGKDIL
jgi:AraC family cel operon transcriptional repressor